MNLNQIDQEPLANAPVFDDEILAVRYRFVREYEASLAFFDALCNGLGDAPAASPRSKASRAGASPCDSRRPIPRRPGRRWGGALMLS